MVNRKDCSTFYVKRVPWASTSSATGLFYPVPELVEGWIGDRVIGRWQEERCGVFAPHPYGSNKRLFTAAVTGQLQPAQ
jgi:hypothetical protein